jgi:tetratricopeptide (TPR) repeat protein
VQKILTQYASQGKELHITDFNKAILLNPKEDKAYGLRRFTYAAKGQFDRAIADFTEAIRLKPQYASTYYFRGRA